MPTTPYAKLFLSINGGALSTGGVTVGPSDTVQLSAESTVGWDRPATVFQITAYPEGWATPDGWTLNAMSGYIEYFANGDSGVTPPLITMPDGSDIAAGIWGKWKFRLLVNGGGGQLTDWDSGVLIVSPNLGLHSVARGERGEFGGAQGQWAREIQRDMKVLDGVTFGFANGAAANTTDDTPTVLLEIPFGDDAAMTGVLLVLAVSTDAPGVYQSYSAGGVISTSGGTLGFDGSPTGNEFTSFSPTSPSFALNYDSMSKVLQIVGTGLASATVHWRVQFTSISIIT